MEQDSENSESHNDQNNESLEAVSDDSFDFDGDDVDLEKVPSWLGEDPNPESFKLGESEEFEDIVSGDSDANSQDGSDDVPDASDLFGTNSPDSLGEIAALEEQRDAYLEALRQLQADFENYKKRVVRDSLEDAENKSLKIIEELLPVLDNFELALKTIEGKDPETKKLRKGIELVFSDLSKVMEKQGLEMIDAQGAVFNPEFHDAVSHEDNGEHEVEVVVEVLRPGYKVRGRVVRPAMVKVAK